MINITLNSTNTVYELENNVKTKGKYISVTHSVEEIKIDVQAPTELPQSLIKGAWRQYLGQNISTAETCVILTKEKLNALTTRDIFILCNRMEISLGNTKNEDKKKDLYLSLYSMKTIFKDKLDVKTCCCSSSKSLGNKIDNLLDKYSDLYDKLEKEEPQGEPQGAGEPQGQQGQQGQPQRPQPRRRPQVIDAVEALEKLEERRGEDITRDLFSLSTTLLR